MQVRTMMRGITIAMIFIATAKIKAADRTTPKSALQTLATAAQNGNSDAYLQTFEFNASEQKLKAALERAVKACARVKEAARSKFGQSKIPPLPISLPDEMIARAKVSILGDDATVDVGKVQPIMMKKVRGEWRTSVNGFFHTPESSLETMVNRLSESLNDAATGITAGKFTSLEEAMQSVKAGAGKK